MNFAPEAALSEDECYRIRGSYRFILSEMIEAGAWKSSATFGNGIEMAPIET